MVLGRIGGGLVLVACGFLAAAALIASGRGAVGLGADGAGGLVVIGAIGSLALGAALVAIGAPAQLRGRLIRAGLAILGCGLGVVIPSGTARMDEPLIFALLIGGALAWLGAILTVVGLLWRAGPARRLGLVFLLGLLAAAVGGALANTDPGTNLLDPIGLAIGIGGGALMLATVAALGVIAIRAAPVPGSAESVRA